MREKWTKIKLYEFTIKDNAATLCFKAEKERFLEPDILNDPDWAALLQKNKKISRLILTGKAPVWLYAFMAYHFVQNGAQSIFVEQPNNNEYNEIFPASQNTSLRPPSWYTLPKENNTDKTFICEINKAKKRVSPDVLQKEELNFPSDISRLILTGKGSVWMYAALAAAAAHAGISETWIDVPNYPCYISIGNASPGISSMKNYDLHGICIAVVGDPNSGKSVFSQCVEQAVTKQVPESWRYDCDMASPTSNWYIDLCQKQRIEEANNLRSNIKDNWDHDKETMTADALGCAKKALKFVIADFPGGIHKDKENIHERIPQGEKSCFVLSIIL